jgi:hypothetical protein
MLKFQIDRYITDNIMKTDFMFLTETWSDKEINIPGFKAFVSILWV